MKWTVTLEMTIEAASREDAIKKAEEVDLSKGGDCMIYDAVPIDPVCEVEGCPATATTEGWIRAKDPTGNASGFIQKRKVCDYHSFLLIGSDKREPSPEKKEPPEFPFYTDAQGREHKEF